MADEEVIVADAPVEEPAVEEPTEVPLEEPAEEETVEELRTRLAKAEELATNQKIRAEKAERKAKETTTTAAPSQMSLADATALLKADVHEEDIDRVEKFAKSEGITVREALKNDELKAILAVRTEKRSTATAANISNVRRGPTKISDDVLISNADKGKLPDDDEGIERLIGAMSKKNR